MIEARRGPKQTIRLALVTTLLLVGLISVWGFIENTWAASFKGQNSNAYVHRAELFLWCGLFSLGACTVFAIWKTLRWFTRRFRHLDR